MTRAALDLGLARWSLGRGVRLRRGRRRRPAAGARYYNDDSESDKFDSDSEALTPGETPSRRPGTAASGLDRDGIMDYDSGYLINLFDLGCSKKSHQ